MDGRLPVRGKNNKNHNILSIILIYVYKCYLPPPSTISVVRLFAKFVVILFNLFVFSCFFFLLYRSVSLFLIVYNVICVVANNVCVCLCMYVVFALLSGVWLTLTHYYTLHFMTLSPTTAFNTSEQHLSHLSHHRHHCRSFLCRSIILLNLLPQDMSFLMSDMIAGPNVRQTFGFFKKTKKKKQRKQNSF